MIIEEIDVDKDSSAREFLSSDKVIQNYTFLQEIGVITFIESLTKDIHNYKTLLTKGLEIFNRESINDILDATVMQISYQFLPSFIAFLWKPIQSRPDITMRAYQDYKTIILDLPVDNITALEAFFQEFPQPISFNTLVTRLKNDEAMEPFKTVRPEIVIPVLGPFGLYGIILVGHKSTGAGYTEEELIFLKHLMSFVSQAIKNYLHYEHSLRDVKTGLYNHGFFMARIKEEVARTKRGPCVSSVIVMDVDKFKIFNDTYGHIAGDQVLEKLAQVIKQSVRAEDIPSRFGGEEFTVLLPNTESGTAWEIAERLRLNVQAMQVPWERPLPQVTISLGIFTFDKDSDMGTNDVIRHADEALYVSKTRGRNRSTIWNPGLIEGANAG